ncbi:MAG TPA: aspartate aminotransferase family protein, partial [Ilumatobacteraceae bacterium]|nr:aspartate aminotransferase family protein [Ilumatobacteraceae bacterium]
IEQPEVILPVTAHPALDKAMHYFGIRGVKAPVTAGFDSGFVADVDAARSLISPNTVAIVGSAGTYPHGLIDPITELGQVALDHGIGLHVDGCLGGFVLAWPSRWVTP